MAKAFIGTARPAGDGNRVAWVDTAKGLCIIMVVMMHSTLGVEKAAGAASWLNGAIEFARPFRMPDFFLISGLFLARAIDRDWRTFLDRKVLHFLYFYLVWVVIQWALKSLYPAWLAGDPLPAIRDLAAASWDPPGTLWFIYMLPVFLVLAKLLRPVHPAVVLAAAALLQAGVHDTGWFVADEFCARFVYFLVGYHAAGLVFALAEWLPAHRIAAWLALAGWALLNGTLVATGWAATPGIGLALGLAGALAVVAVSALLTAGGTLPVLRTAGHHSLVIYLAFFIPMAAVRTVLLRTGVIPDLGIVSLLVTAIAVTTPLLAYRLVRTTPLRVLFERPAWARLGKRTAPVSPVLAE